MKTVVILGGTGILSTSISKYCKNEGFNVLHFNRGITNKIPDVKTIIGDRHSKNDLCKVLLYMPDIIIDMLCFDEYDAYIAISVFAGKIKQYIFCSTASVYSPVNDASIIYEYSSKNPCTEYGRNKLKAENKFISAYNKGLFELTIFRPGHVYNEKSFINYLSLDGLFLIKRLVNNQDVILTENGERIYQACHADNIGLAFSKVCNNSVSYGKIYNIAGQEKLTWNYVYNYLINEIGSDSKIRYFDTEYLLNLYPDKFEFMSTGTRYDTILSSETLCNDIFDYKYIVNFCEGIKSILLYNKFKAINYISEEDRVYDEIIDNYLSN